MTVSEDTDSYPIAPPPIMATTIVERRRRPGIWRLAGTGLIAWGVIGLVLLAIFFNALSAPIGQVETLTTSLETQRAAAMAALDSARDTIDHTAVAVRGMDTSLGDANTAIGQATTIATNISDTMDQLAQQMGISIFGLQPLVGLASGFSNVATELDTLSGNLGTIGASIDANRNDALAVADSLDGLSSSLGDLKTALNSGPGLDNVTQSLDSARIGFLALLAWLGLLAVGSIAAGIGCWVVARAD